MTLCEVTYPSKFNEAPLTMNLMHNYIKLYIRADVLYMNISKQNKMNDDKEMKKLYRLSNLRDWAAAEFMRYLSFTIESEEELQENLEKITITYDISKWDEKTEIQYIPVK